MIPNRDTEYVSSEVEVLIQPSFTHKMHIEEEKVKGYIEIQSEAVRQMIYKCINTEQGAYPIYEQFGIKKRDLFGKRKEYAFMVLSRRITEALLLDDRIKEVTDFVYMKELSKEDRLAMRFKVKTISGSEVTIEEVMKFE